MSSWLFWEEIQVANKYLRKYSTPLAVWERQMEASLRSHLTQTCCHLEKNKGWRGYGKGIVIRW